MNSRPRPLVLCILDGWGERQKSDDNAIEIARAPNWHRLKARWPHAQLQASEHYVGLPDGQMGNSEVGHTNIGAGRLVLQDLPRIDAAIAEGKLASMPALRDFIGKLKVSRGTAHLMGLMSPGGVHSHQRQIAALARILAEAEVPVDSILCVTCGNFRSKLCATARMFRNRTSRTLRVRRISASCMPSAWPTMGQCT